MRKNRGCPFAEVSILFVEPQFFLFFAIVLALHWTLKTNNARKWLLLSASYYFYGSWDWRFAAMLLILSAGDYFFARRIEAAAGSGIRKVYLSASLLMNLSVLVFFKYFHFFLGSAVALGSVLHLHLSEPAIKILLPVGVSFFTFQSLSYTIDVYRREIPAVHSLRDYLMFAAFFPQLVAGPIVRPKYFVPQMDELRHVSLTDIKHMLYLFLLGYIKKTAIADNISPFVDRVFNSPTSYTAAASINATWLYAVQIFCDFSGYSDMAIAVAGLMGYRLAVNFDAPYLATSIQEFWRRWHISLSQWIRDYIYISLGGRAKRLLVTYRNLMVTMMIGGLWHGAAWTFVVWGCAHGAGLVVNHEFARLFPRRKATTWWTIVSWFITINFVCLCWILFRANDFPTALLMIRRYTLLDKGGEQTIPPWLFLVGPFLLACQYLMRTVRFQNRVCELTWPEFAFAYGCTWSFALAMLPLGYRPFIYFQF
jgi:alginate O-acetyltransferase complex protein AlgI